MIVFRISNELFKDDISGNGAAMNGSRWNSKGVRMLYTGEFISLVILESLVHIRETTAPERQYLLQVEIPQTDFSEISNAKIKENWQAHINYTQWMGDEFIKANETLFVKVPSVVVPQEHNFLVNPLHKDFKKVKIVASELLNLDKRLLLK